MNSITPRIALEVAHHEAIIRQAYKDSVGVWTWSVGLTNASGHNVERYIGKPQTMQKCLEVFLWALERYAHDVREVFRGYKLTEAQFAAALSFHWNTGAIRRASWVDKWKAGDLAAADVSFMAWCKPAEIMERRMDERDLLFLGKWSGDGKTTEYTELTSRGTPKWNSGVRRDIRGDIEAILGATKPAAKPKVNPWAAVLAAIMAIFRKDKA